MSLKFADHFIYGGGSYDINYDTGSNTGVVSYSGPGSAASFIPLPNAGRAYTTGQFIREFCSDNPATTKVKVYASTSSPFCTFVLEADSADCSITPPGPGECDLHINSVATTDETETGGNDGTVTVNASTSATGLQFSKDGITYQTGNLFGGLAPGNYTIYSKDDNDCIVSQPFTILSFSNPVQNFTDGLPVVSVPIGNISRWNAAFNPIVVNYQRKDYVITSITQSGAQLKVQINTVLTIDQYQAAIQNGIYIKTPKYDLTIFPVSYSAGDGFVINAPYLGDDTTGFLNIPILKPNFYIQTEITAGDNPVTPKVIIAEHSPNSTGATKADLSPYLQTLLSPDETFNYLTNSYRDYNLGGSYQIRYREVWDTGNSAWFSAPYPLYYTYSAMQLGERYGGNMAAYVPFLSVTQQYKAKFLNDFVRPRYWAGLPFDLAFIYSENVINQALNLELIPDCGTPVNSLLLNADASYLLNADRSRFVINRIYNPNIQGYPVIQALGVNRVLVPNVFDCCANNINANIWYNPSLANGEFTGTATESISPYLDGAVGFNVDGTEVRTLYGTTTGPTDDIQAGKSYSFVFYVQTPSALPNTRLVGTVIKDSVIIYRKSIPMTEGSSATKTGIVQPGSVYEYSMVTVQGGAVPTDIGIADNNPVPNTKTYVMQDLNIKHECPCDDPFIYLKWINSKGGWSYWRFGFNQTLSQTVSGSEQISKFVNDWENDQTIEDFIARNANKKIAILAGNLTLDELQGLQWMTNSRRVQMLTSLNPVKWQTVTIPDGDFNAGDTKKGMGNVKLSIILPAINSQRG